MTKVINLFAGSSTGKSTLASALFTEMKLRGINCELVREYIKVWAWEGRTPGKYDQIYIFGQQAYSEGLLYEKVDYIITDSPLYLVPFYEEYLIKKNIVAPAVFNFIKHAEDHGVSFHNFWLNRPESFDPRGRYETKDQAIAIDKALKEWLTTHNVNFTELSETHTDRVDKILEKLGIKDLPKVK